MTTHKATTRWTRKDALFTDLRYSRAHCWHFDGGAEVAASASPHNVRGPYVDPAGVDPEEAFVAAVSSCHLLSFLYVAAKRGLVVDHYEDSAEGQMGADEQGRAYIARVVLRPWVRYVDRVPDVAEEDALHHEAHEMCFVAHSIRSDVVVETAQRSCVRLNCCCIHRRATRHPSGGKSGRECVRLLAAGFLQATWKTSAHQKRRAG